MSTIRIAKQVAFAFTNLIFKSIRRLLLVVLGLMACAVFPAMAQPVKGSVYKDFLPMGSGASVARPEGVWEATQISSLDYPGTNWEVYTLKISKPMPKFLCWWFGRQRHQVVGETRLACPKAKPNSWSMSMALRATRH